jgi:hypothetical protein
MAETKKKAAATRAAATETATTEKKWVPTEGAKKKATTKRIIAMLLWVVAIGLEVAAIFWLLRQRTFVGGDGEFVRDPETGLLSEKGATATFPDWAFYTLIGALVVIAALAITGSILWKQANRLDPASREDKVRFFVQNQLGVIIAILAFLPLIIMIFMNKDMDGKQKGIAGGIGIVLALVAAYFGAEFNPASVEQYTADQSAVIQLLGEDKVYWVAGGSVYHVCDEVSDLQTGSEILNGTTAEAIEAKKSRLTLRFVSELETCGLNVPTNADEITDALRQIQAGNMVMLPKPEWANPEDAPIQVG